MWTQTHPCAHFYYTFLVYKYTAGKSCSCLTGSSVLYATYWCDCGLTPHSCYTLKKTSAPLELWEPISWSPNPWMQCVVMLMYLQCNQGGHHVSLDWTGYRQVFLHTCTVERVTLHSILHNRDVTMWYWYILSVVQNATVCISVLQLWQS
jgi:hypothetical protein